MTCSSLVISIEESEAWQEYVHRDKGIKILGYWEAPVWHLVVAYAYVFLRCKRLNSETCRL
jgi:hypothetical protein